MNQLREPLTAAKTVCNPINACNISTRQPNITELTPRIADAIEPIEISVVICTYQRAELLKLALQSLCEQSLDSKNFEIIVVDNNSLDHTKLITDAFISEHPNIRYCMEKKQGLSYARNRGWRAARGRYVAYIDDECKVPPDWLAAAKAAIDVHAPAILGGPFGGYHALPAPRWWKDIYGGFTYADNPTVLGPHEHLSGGNFIVRRELFELLGGFDVSLGMSGHKIAFGEESEFQQRVRTARPDELIYYDPGLYLYHLVRPEKYSLWWLAKSRFSGGRDSYFVFRKEDEKEPRRSRSRLILQAARIGMACFKDLVANVVKRDRVQYPYIQNYFYEETGEYIHKLGVIHGQLFRR